MPSKLRVLFDSLHPTNTFLIWVTAEIFLFSPLVYAHGDDNVTAASFIGPLIGFFVFATVVGLGKALLRMIIKKA